MRIGIDVGGVIIDGGSKFFTDDFLTVPAIDNALDALIDLRWLGHSLHIISKASPRTQKKTMEWLEANGYFSVYVLWRDHVDFCRKVEEKLPIAQRLGIDIMIDDRLDVCEIMSNAGISAILFTDWRDTLKRIDELSLV